MKGDVLDFIDLVRSECEANGVDVAFLPRRGVMGYFDPAKKRIEVSIAEPDWLTILAHEFSHMRQWRLGLFPEVWPDTGPYELFDAWEAGAVIPSADVADAVGCIQRCELDAERRALKLIRDYGLTADLGAWLSRAWCNVMGYEFGRRHRTWWSTEPWEVPIILERLPRKLPRIPSLGTLDTGLEQLILAHCCQRH